ncbi:helix-turn-helix transcriptional regulator [Clostridium sp.]|uniref:helix-turn-helix domain-containing protein n=1 Tax=Clostridium sp. TaxID=1506 RepID=UPI00261A3A3F|nr:helix-turn-helix transcriptional regulator [Clostridium sp.]
MKKIIGEKLQFARKTIGFTQEYVANKLMISRGKVIKIEKGEIEVDLSLLNSFSNLYGYSLDYFINFKEENEDETLSFAFRAAEITEQESEILAWGNKILTNIRLLDEIIEEANI